MRPTVAEIKAFTASSGIKFPPGTQFECYGHDEDFVGSGRATRIKALVPSASLDNFLAQNPLSLATWNQGVNPFVNEPNTPGWMPKSVTKSRFDQIGVPFEGGTDYLDVLVDDAPGSFHAVYLQWTVFHA